MSKATKLVDVDDTYEPCAKEIFMGQKCMQKNLQDRSRCQQYLDNVNVCRKFWKYIEALRRKDGMKPLLPPPEEREEIRRFFLPEYSLGLKVNGFKEHFQKKKRPNIRKE